MDKASPETKIAEMVVETEELCSICKEEPDPSSAINLAVSVHLYIIICAVAAYTAVPLVHIHVYITYRLGSYCLF